MSRVGIVTKICRAHERFSLHLHIIISSFLTIISFARTFLRRNSRECLVVMGAEETDASKL